MSVLRILQRQISIAFEIVSVASVLLIENLSCPSISARHLTPSNACQLLNFLSEIETFHSGPHMRTVLAGFPASARRGPVDDPFTTRFFR